jgi:hypothetical protein
MPHGEHPFRWSCLQKRRSEIQGRPGGRRTIDAKILAGGAGVWGQILMPPHPLHSIERIRQTVSWVLALKNDPASPAKTGSSIAAHERKRIRAQWGLRNGDRHFSGRAFRDVEGVFSDLPAPGFRGLGFQAGKGLAVLAWGPVGVSEKLTVEV